MVVPYASTSADCPVLHGQVFRGDLRDLRWRYLLQFLNKPSHGFEGCDHFEDAYYEALSGDAVKRIRILSFDLRDRPLKLMLAGRSLLNLLNFLHQHSLSSVNRNALASKPGRIICYFDVVSLGRDSNLDPALA